MGEAEFDLSLEQLHIDLLDFVGTLIEQQLLIQIQ